MLAACDGLWKCFSPQEAVEKAWNLMTADPTLAMFISGKVDLTRQYVLKEQIKWVCIILSHEINRSNRLKQPRVYNNKLY